MKDEVSFGNWLKQRRNTLDLTQAELADEVGCARITVQKIESGERRPSKQMAERFAICLNIGEDARKAFLRFARGEPITHQGIISSFSADGLSGGIMNFSALPPLPSTPLYGRDQDIDSLRKQLLSDDTRFLTLIGPPGVGKSRLGMQVASELMYEFEHGVFYVSLAPVSDPNLVLPAIARALGVRDSGNQPLVDRLNKLLWDKELLLLLDNFEQVISSAPQFTRLLTICPQLKILITSRIASRVRGERLFPVRPLALPDLGQMPDLGVLLEFPSVALFVDRAQAVKPNFFLNEENAADIIAVCHRLDGLPLAIELISSWIHLLPPHALLGNLDRLILSQTGGIFDVDGQQQTMFGAIDWSYQLLPSKEQKLFTKLAVFVGGWTLEAAESICLPSNDIQGFEIEHQTSFEIQPSSVLEGLASLLNKSLVVQYELDGISRFTFLEVIRLYALEKLLSCTEADHTRWRHTKYFLELAEEAVIKTRGPEQLKWLDLCEIEHNNMRASLKWLMQCSEKDYRSIIDALRLSIALQWFWSRRGYLNEGCGYLKQVRTLAENYLGSNKQDHKFLSLYAGLLYSLGTITWLQGNLVEAQPILERSHVFWQMVGPSGECGRAYAQTIQLMVKKELGHHDQARDLGIECVETLRKTGDQWGLAMALNCYGSAALDARDFTRAQSLLDESIDLFRNMGDEWGQALPLIHLSRLAMHQGRFDEARQLGENAVFLFRKIDDSEQVAVALSFLGDTARAQGDIQQAEAYYEQSLILWQIHRHRSFTAQVESKLADIIHNK